MRRPSEPPVSFRAELGLIPPAAWVAAGLLLLVFYGLLMPVMLHGIEGEEGAPLLIGIGGFLGIFYAIWLLLICYTNVDAGRRGMGRLAPTLLVALAPLLGFIAYILFRKPVTRRCPACGESMFPELVYCSSCGTQMEPACPSCHAKVDPAWAHCGSCGTDLLAQTLKAEGPPKIPSIS